VVVYDFDVEGASIFPTKANPPSFVDTDAALTLPVGFKSLQMIAWRHCEVLQGPSPVEIEQFAPRGPLERFKSRHRQIVEQILGFLVFEGPDHAYSILRDASYVKRNILQLSRWKSA
jgi:hypothetical protein